PAPKNKKVDEHGKRRGAEETLYLKRKQDERDARYLQLVCWVNTASLAELKTYRGVLQNRYNTNVRMVKPITYDGVAARAQLKQRGYAPEQISTEATFTRCETWHKLYLRKEQKDDLLRRIDARFGILTIEC